MSTLIVRCMCPHYEDYDPYGIERNAVQGFPELWPEEMHAEGALYLEHKRMMQYAHMHRPRLAKADSKDAPSIVRALVSIASENGWEVKNEDVIKRYGCNTVYTIPPRTPEEEKQMPTNWDDAVRWMDKKMTQDERDEEEQKLKWEREKKKRRQANRIEIDAKLLHDIIGNLVTFCSEGGKRAVVKDRPSSHSREDIVSYALATLVCEKGWTQNDPCGYKGVAPRIYKTP